MRIKSAVLGAVCLSLLLTVKVQAAAPEELVSNSAILIDADSGQVLFDKNMQQPMYPASTTKILTALLVSENCAPDEIITVSEAALEEISWDSSHIALQAGEQLTVEDAMYALMLPSANDAANVLAEYVAGSQEAFAAMMNARAQQIGAADSHFVNPHGLHDENHYTTVYDMALITREAVRNETFMKFFGADLYTMGATNLQEEERPFSNYHYMLVPTAYYYDADVKGGKVGYTKEARHTMSTLIERDGRRLICVVMDSPGRWDKFKDTRQLKDYGLDEFRQVTLPQELFAAEDIPAGEGSVSFEAAGDLTVLLRNDLDPADITITPLPESFADASALPSAVEVQIQTGDATLPDLLGLQLLQSIASLPAAAQASVPLAAAGEEEQGGQLRWLLLAALAAAVLIPAGAVLLRYRRMQKQRLARIRQYDRQIRRNYQNRRSA